MQDANITIILDTIDKVRRFVNTVSHLDGDYDLVSGRFTVDAKSIMGIFSLDLSKPLQLRVHEGAISNELSALLKEFTAE